MAHAVLAAAFVASVAGCWSYTRPEVSGSVDAAPPGADAVAFTYLGVGGWIMERGDVQIIAAPLFTNPSFLRTGMVGIRSDTARVSEYMSPYDVAGARAILVGHGPLRPSHGRASGGAASRAGCADPR